VYLRASEGASEAARRIAERARSGFRAGYVRLKEVKNCCEATLEPVGPNASSQYHRAPTKKMR
jgi:hypothetical protein